MASAVYFQQFENIGDVDRIADQLVSLQMRYDGNRLAQPVFHATPMGCGIMSQPPPTPFPFLPWAIKSEPQQQPTAAFPFPPMINQSINQTYRYPSTPIPEQIAPIPQQPCRVIFAPQSPCPIPIHQVPTTPIDCNFDPVDNRSISGFWPTAASPHEQPTSIAISPPVALFPVFGFQFPSKPSDAVGIRGFAWDPSRFGSEPNSPPAPKFEGRRRNSYPDKQSNDGCTFCKRNGESRIFYQAHQLRDDKFVLQCPILRAFRCPICRATGDDAHTKSYCPQRPKDAEKSFGRVRLNRTATGKVKVRRSE